MRTVTWVRSDRWALTFLACLTLLLGGCVGEALEQATKSARNAAKQTANAAQQAQAREYLRNLGLLYHQYHDTHRQGPPSWEEAKAFAVSQTGTSQPLEKLQQMGYTVAWGMRFPDVTIGISNFVVAYPSDGPQNGGVVLLLDGSVQAMSAEQLNAALANQASVRSP